MKARNYKLGMGNRLVKLFQCVTLDFDLDIDLGHSRVHLCAWSTIMDIMYGVLVVEIVANVMICGLLSSPNCDGSR